MRDDINYPSYSGEAFMAPTRDAEVLHAAATLLKMYDVNGTCYYTLTKRLTLSPVPFVLSIPGWQKRRFKTSASMLHELNRIVTKINLRRVTA